MSQSLEDFLTLDKFAYRQFNQYEEGKLVKEGNIPVNREDFLPAVLKALKDESVSSVKSQLQDGYAPFCKHLFIPNFTEAVCGSVEITEENEKHLRTRYEARTKKELPVLVRYFPKTCDEVKATRAKYLDLILYSREQLQTEYKAQNETYEKEHPWAIISIKPQDLDKETPMQPITMMRNALGCEEGGSGVRLVRENYEESVAFWEKHAPIL